jgi:hypothetical protein
MLHCLTARMQKYTRVYSGNAMVFQGCFENCLSLEIEAGYNTFAHKCIHQVG